MNKRSCGGGCGEGDRDGGAMRFVGLLLAFAFLFAGDVVRLHGHPDGVPASTDCAACVAGLSAAAETDPPPAPEPPIPSAAAAPGAEPNEAPALLFVRQGGLRDPPTLSPDTP